MDRFEMLDVLSQQSALYFAELVELRKKISAKDGVRTEELSMMNRSNFILQCDEDFLLNIERAESLWLLC